MIKQGFQKLVQWTNRIRQATTKGVIIAYLLFTVVLGILAGIGMSAFNLYVCTFITNGRGKVVGKDPLWYQEDESKILTTEVSDACSHYMPG